MVLDMMRQIVLKKIRGYDFFINKQTQNQDGWEVTMLLYQRHGGDPPTTFDIA